MAVVAQSTSTFVDNYSKEFERNFMELLSRRWKTKKVSANIVYNEYIADRTHTHMNATRWSSLTEFVRFLAQSGKVTLEETPKALYIRYIDRGEIERKKKLDEKILKDIEADKLEEMLLEEQKRITQLVEAFISQKHFSGDDADGDEDEGGDHGDDVIDGGDGNGEDEVNGESSSSSAPREKIGFTIGSKKPVLSFQHSKPSSKKGSSSLSSSSLSSSSSSLEPPQDLVVSETNPDPSRDDNDRDEGSDEINSLSTSSSPPKQMQDDPATHDLEGKNGSSGSEDIQQTSNEGDQKEKQSKASVAPKMSFAIAKTKAQPFITKKETKPSPSTGLGGSGEKRPRPSSALEEIMEREQKKLKMNSGSSSSSSSSSAIPTTSVEPSWIFPGLIVRCKHKTIGAGKYHNSKGLKLSSFRRSFSLDLLHQETDALTDRIDVNSGDHLS